MASSDASDDDTRPDHYFYSSPGRGDILAGLDRGGVGDQYDAWRAIVEGAQWKTPEDVKNAHPKASILKSGRVVFNIKANDYRLIALVEYKNGVVMIRFLGSHEEYDKINAETV
jgi:mRNA interferase HigB